MKHIGLIAQGYYGKGPGWEAVVTDTIMTVLQEAYEFQMLGLKVTVVIGTGELERDTEVPGSISVARKFIENLDTEGNDKVFALRMDLQDLLENAIVLTTPRTTAQEFEQFLAICKDVGADRIGTVHRPEHVRAYSLLRKLGQAAGLQVYGLPGSVDFPGVTDAVCLEGWHMDDPALDAFAMYENMDLRKQLGAEPFGIPLSDLPGYVAARNALRESHGLAPLNITTK